MRTVMFTGHRAAKLCGWNPAMYQICRTQLKALIYDLRVNHNCDVFITGGAQGFDQLVFTAVEELKQEHPEFNIKNCVYTPFPNHHARWAKTGLFSQAEYEDMLTKADFVKPTMTEKPEGIDQVKAALMQRNRDMLADANLVVAFITDWELNNNQEHSGTKSCVRDAQNMHKRIIQVPYEIRVDGLRIIR